MQTCYLACVVAALWRPGGPWDDLGTLGSTTKDTLRSMHGFSTIFGGFRDPILEAFLDLWLKKVRLFMLVSRILCLVIFWLESGCLGLEKQAFGHGSIAKTYFRSNWICHDLVRAARECPSTLGGPSRIEQRSVVSLLPPALQYAGAKRLTGGRAGRRFAPPSGRGSASRCLSKGAPSAPLSTIFRDLSCPK